MATREQTTSERILAERDRYVARGIAAASIVVDRAEGARVWDVDGRSYVDFAGGIACQNTGHGFEPVVAAIHEQAERYLHQCFMVGAYEPYVEVCKRLAELSPCGSGEQRSILVNTGAEGIENAVKIARAHTRRQAVVVFDHGYHGRTNLTMALTAKNMPYKHSFGPFAPEVYRVPMSYPFRDPAGLTGEAAAARAIDLIEKQVGADEVAAVVIEPIQGEGGFVVPAAGFLAALASWCTDNGAVFVADEIQTGFCRTGDWFALDHEDVVPDLVATAKGIAGGLPLAGVTGRAEIMDAAHVGGLGGTYGGNPVACAAALGSIETMESLDLVRKARHIGEVMTGRLREMAATHDVVGDVRGRGAMVAIELTTPGTTEPDAATAAAVAKACHADGLVVLTCGTDGNVLRFLPPLVMPEHLLDEGLGIIEKALASSA